MKSNILLLISLAVGPLVVGSRGYAEQKETRTHPITVTVLGQVMNPGTVELTTSSPTAFDALQACGGAKITLGFRLYITRKKADGGTEKIEVPFSRGRELKRDLEKIRVQDGDRLAFAEVE